MSLPVCLGAKILGLKIYLLEPNLTLGRSNNFFLKFSEKIICYSKELSNFPKKFLYKIEVTNPLISKNFYKIEHKNKTNKKFCILISGGSQGAKIFDEIIKDAITKLPNFQSIKIIQQTSPQNLKILEDFYNKNNIENVIFNFEKNFINLIAESDLCITRAGASSLAEIAMMNKPFIAIPCLAQKIIIKWQNARFYEAAGCCWVLDQKDFNIYNLNNILLNIFNENSNYIKTKFEKFEL